jgi:hypothetical protein
LEGSEDCAIVMREISTQRVDEEPADEIVGGE